MESLESRRLLATISGSVFSDLNADGARGDEPPLAAWTVYLDIDRDGLLDDDEPSTQTNELGQYTFQNVPPGNYHVATVVPRGWAQTSPAFPGGADEQRVDNIAGEALRDDAAIRSAIDHAGAIDRYTVSQLRSARAWVVGLPRGASIEPLIRETDAVAAARAEFLPDTYVLSYSPRRSGVAIAGRLAGAANVSFYYPLLGRVRESRFIPNDPLFASQWHLRNTGQTGGTSGADANLTSAWDSARGQDVVIGIVDDGIDYNHEDLASNYVASLSYDYFSNDSNPAPGLLDDHGTAVAGIAAARGHNGIGVSGAAPMASIAGIRLTAGAASDLQESRALTHRNDAVSIYNSSWGPTDNGTHLEAPGPMTLAALASGAQSGRGGRGSIFVWAAGNGNNAGGGTGDNVNYDGYANSRYVIPVGAFDHNGVHSYYSELGAPLLVSAPSSGFGNGTTTTDRTGALGYQIGNYTGSFTGTSSASPLVAGVVALMLQMNPALTWRDVQHILAHSARMTDPADAGWTTNAAGLHVNHKYGFGAIDAAAAVELAAGWTNVGSEQSIHSGTIAVNQTIPDNNPAGISRSFHVDSALRVETVQIVLKATHTNRGQLRVVLISPSGAESILADVHGDTNDHYNNWVFTTRRNWDESSQGTWTLRVTDAAGGAVGTLDSFAINIYGAPVNPATHYIVVNKSDSIGAIDFGAHDIAAPEVVSMAFHYLDRQKIVIEFSEDVIDLEPRELIIANIPADAIDISYSPATHTAVVTFSGGILPDGNYLAAIQSGDVFDPSGNALAPHEPLTFFVLAGDANRDRRVDIADLSALTANWNASDANFAEGDFTYDQRVDERDLAVLSGNWQKILPPDPQAAPSATQTRTALGRPRVAETHLLDDRSRRLSSLAQLTGDLLA